MAQQAFEGEGGLHNPAALQDGGNLAGGDALYEIPAGIMQWNLKLDAGAVEDFRFALGPAHDRDEVEALTEKYLAASIAPVREAYRDYVMTGLGSLKIESPDETFNQFVNHWLPRQVFYHGDTNRLTTDPQTRNYLQDALGMIYIRHGNDARRYPEGSEPSSFIPERCRMAFCSGRIAELKYINQVPHTDHAVWLVIVTSAYLDETNDRAILEEQIAWVDSEEPASLYEHISKALRFLASAVDERGLPYIDQGDWCDPMNMVGYKGKGVSGWLAEASSYAMTLWSAIADNKGDTDNAAWLKREADAMNARINRHLWDGNWYGRGITDDNVVFGISRDVEGRIYLNTQSWAFLCGAADDDRRRRMLKAVDDELDTPYGVAMFAPAYTAMRADVGRVTQKWPGSAENGAVYNHAAAFYAASLYHIKEADRAFDVLDKMVTRPDENDIAHARPAAALCAQLLSWRMASVSTHSRPVQQSLQHRYGILVLPGLWSRNFAA